MSCARLPHRDYLRYFALCLFLSALPAIAVTKDEPSVDDLKARVASASVGDRAKLCIQIARRQLDESDKQYAASDIEKAQASLTDVVAYAELARDYSIQSHKHEKDTEIAARAMARKLNGILHSLPQQDQPAVKDALQRIEKVRDDLLLAMFPKGAR